MASNDGFIDTRLHQAAEEKDVESIKSLLSSGVDVDTRDEYGRTPLIFAAEKNQDDSHYDVIKLLLENGADANAKNKYYGNTPLFWLSGQSDVKTIQLLLSYNADVNAKNESGISVILGAIRENKIEILQLLIDDGLDVSWLLHFTIFYCNDGSSHLEVIEKLLENGADVNAQDEVEGRTPLHYLTHNRRPSIEAIELLLKFNADVNIKDKLGETPLFFVVRMGIVEIAQFLFDRGADLSVVNKFRSTLLHVARKIDIIKWLVKKNADVNALNSRKHTPFMAMMKTKDHLAFHEFHKLRDPQADLKAEIMFYFKYADLGIIGDKYNDILENRDNKHNQKVIIEQFGKLHLLDFKLHKNNNPITFDCDEQKNYFERCTEELELAKSTKLPNCWITFFNLLVDSKRKLKNYAGNPDVIEGLKKIDYLEKFPIYGATMKRNVEKGLVIRQAFDKSIFVLSEQLPVFNPNHLIIGNVLDCLTLKDHFKLTL